ncbi:MAG: enoyl-CoA hydratase/isomerase family protein [Chloroflexi bacterium]|nr:enoyl-CoA hydratase/isomerase family protein [Chloroflexota bacterium]
MAEDDLLIDVKDGVATITLNRPRVLNAFIKAMTAALGGILKELEAREDVRVVIIRGAGDKAFCVGNDLREEAGETKKGQRYTEVYVIGSLAQQIKTLKKPTIAAVRGYCRGGGNWLAASCDIVVAAEDATFALPQLNFGVFDLVSGVPMMQRIGRSKLLDIILTTDVINATEAKQIGLVDRLVPVGQFESAVNELAQKIASRDPRAVRAGKEALNLLVDTDYCKSVRTVIDALAVLLLSRESSTAAEAVERHYAPMHRR